jgi:hypothetical protein
MPITSPRTFTAARRVPGLIAASVWMKSWMLLCERLGSASDVPWR